MVLPIFKKIGLSRYSINLGMFIYWGLVLPFTFWLLSTLAITRSIDFVSQMKIVIILLFGFLLEIQSKFLPELASMLGLSKFKMKITMKTMFSLVIVFAINDAFSKINFTPENFLYCIKTGKQFQLPDNILENPISIYLLMLGMLGIFFYDISLSYKAWIIKGKDELKYGKQLQLKF